MQKLIIDTDPGIDDALALLLALSAKSELEVEAITTVNGNVGVDQVTKNVFRILDVAREKRYSSLQRKWKASDAGER